MKCAFFVHPHIGGTFSVFQRLRTALAPSGIELRWLATGSDDRKLSAATSDDTSLLGDADATGDVVDAMGRLTEQQRAAAFVEFLRDKDYRAVFVNVLTNRFETNMVRYLPDDILRIMIVHNITPGTYAAAAAIRDHVHASIGVSPRCRDDLIRAHGFSPQRTFHIPHGLDLPADLTAQKAMAASETDPRASRELRLLFLGRIEDNAKGVFWLPQILEQLTIPYRLTVAGNGPDLNELRRSLARFGDRVQFSGWVAPDQVSALARQHDVLIMPSRFEGFGLTLIEAMAEGCVPVVSRIHGVTDSIVDDRRDGFLFPIGDHAKAARLINELARDPARLHRAGLAAIAKVHSKFDNAAIGRAYGEIINRLADKPPAIAKPLAVANWKMPAELHRSMRSHLPKPVKNWLRQIREKLRNLSPAM